MVRFNSKFSLFTIIIACILIFPIKQARAYIQTFDDSSSLVDFEIDSNGGSVSVESGEMFLSSTFGNRFPYVRLLSKKFPQEVNTIELRFIYPLRANFGTGVVIDNNYPTNGVEYDVGHNSMLWGWGDVSGVYLGYFPFQYTLLPQDNLYHILRAEKVTNGYSIFIDNVYKGNLQTDRIISAVWFGNPQITQTFDYWSSIGIDYLVINDTIQNPSISPSPTTQPSPSPTPSPIPSPIPSPSPTPDPSPTPSTIFPYLSQSYTRWGSELYDSAYLWSPGKETITRWGCALTSVAMVLQDHNIHLPTGEDVTPSNLNLWLKSQKDGYVGQGLLNWLAVTRLAKQSRTNNHAPYSLEFRRYPFAENTVTNLLSSHTPQILKENAHFVVAYENNGSLWWMADPANSSRKTANKSGYDANYSYTPSYTNLSYILLVTDPSVMINLAGSDQYFESLGDDVDGQSTLLKKIVTIAQPAKGEYELRISGPQGTKVESYLYDRDGNVVTDLLDLGQATDAIFQIVYDPYNTPASHIDVSAAPILAYLRSLRALGSRYNGIYQALYSRFMTYLQMKNFGYQTTNYATNLNRYVSSLSPIRITTETKNKLNNYIYLLEHN